MLSSEEKSYLLRLARASLKAYFEKREWEPEAPSPEKYPHLWERRGVFVTLFKRGELRGCIGDIAPEEPLFRSVAKVALSSALSDPRFPPLREEELSELEIEISVLSPFKKASPEDLVLGRQGIYLKKGYHRGLLLPQVATEYGWDRETFLRMGCRKAGLPEDCYLDPEVELYLFEAEVFKESEFSS